MTHVLLVGEDVALLEGLAQSLAAQGHSPAVATSLYEARELAITQPPLVLVVNRSLASSSGADLLAIPLSAGGLACSIAPRPYRSRRSCPRYSAPCSPTSPFRSSDTAWPRWCSRSASVHERPAVRCVPLPPTIARCNVALSALLASCGVEQLTRAGH